ncbi:MAG: hypothetical protein ACF8CQ_16655 [Rhodopirellula sp. JB044]|uniref:hypothetical protein n=1 Tax=Rhodopirellula sp. JB044 TaxID=3342844 RepID=UPI00370CEE7C
MSRSSRRDEVDLPDPPRIQRPGRPFLCGRGQHGNHSAGDTQNATPCAEGPTIAGECPFAGRCHDDSTPGSGKKKTAGKKGANDFSPCRPVPTWAGRRRRWTAGVLLLFAFALVGVFGTSFAPEFVRPGNLSTSHAQILTGDLTAGGCTVCHGNVSAETWMAMKEAGHVGAEESLTMTDRCVACHHDRIPVDLATSAHNLNAETRLAIGEQRREIMLAAATDSSRVRTVSGADVSKWWPPPAVSQDDVACSVCHREHHGADADLKAITDSRCQTCHSNRFGSFADSHPEFTNWPTSSEHAIAFDHSRHANLHFPKTAEAEGPNQMLASQFDCRSCHMIDPAIQSDTRDASLNDSIVGTLPFEATCAACHDESLGVQIASGPALIELPILPREVAEQIESWPENAIGPPDGKLSAWMLLLLHDQDPSVDFAPLANLALVDWRSRRNQELAVRLGKAVREFAIALSIDGQAFLLDAAQRAGADLETSKAFAGSFPTQVMRDAASEWFGRSNVSANDRFSARQSAASDSTAATTDSGGDLLVDWSAEGGDDLLLSGAASDDPLSLGGVSLNGDSHSSLLVPGGDANDRGSVNWEDELGKRFDAARAQSLGGWYRDDLTMSIRYRGSGHSDAVLRSLVEVASSSDPVIRELVMQQPAVAACVSCHTSLPWREPHENSLRNRLTKFSHRPHMDITALQNCEHCHSMRPSLERKADAPSFAEVAPPSPLTGDALCDTIGLLNHVSARPDGASDVSPHLPPGDTDAGETARHGHSDFLPLRKAACAHCHTANAAGDHCTTCHRYHVGDVSQPSTTVAPLEPVR